jgi:hypothetical protein
MTRAVHEASTNVITHVVESLDTTLEEVRPWLLAPRALSRRVKGPRLPPCTQSSSTPASRQVSGRHARAVEVGLARTRKEVVSGVHEIVDKVVEQAAGPLTRRMMSQHQETLNAITEAREELSCLQGEHKAASVDQRCARTNVSGEQGEALN